VNNKTDRYYITRLLVPMVFMVLALWFGIRFIGTQDFPRVLTWWITLLLLGVAFQPLSICIFSKFHDGGWLFSKVLGLAVSGWLMWFLSSCHILKFSQRWTSIVVVILCFAINVFGYSFLVQRKNRKKKFFDAYSADMICSIFSVEVIFLCVFIGWCYIKGINPDAYGTERFMDFSYMMSISKTDYMPASDVWFAGNGINYYYVGQYMATFLTKLSGLSVDYAYNLSMMTLATFGLCLTYSLGVNVMRQFILERKVRLGSDRKAGLMTQIGSVTEEDGEPFWRPVAAGTIGGIAVAIAGNLHYPIYKYLFPKWQNLIGSGEHYSYWFPDATRFIGYNPDVDDKTIHEFPIYSYVVGDLHAHVINTIFVLTLLAVLFAWLLRRKDRMGAARQGAIYGEDLTKGALKKELLTEVFQPEIIIAAFLVGMFYMTNTWDFAIYFVVSGAVILFSNLVVYGFKKNAWLLTAFQALLFIVLHVIISLPFRLNFKSISSSIAFCDTHTSLWQLFVLWGLPTTCIITFLVILIRERKEMLKYSVTEKKSKKKKVEESEETEAHSEENAFCKNVRGFFANMSVSELFILVLGLCAIGLVLLPEIIYVVDIYGGAYKRANTMFKLTYQAFIMFGIAMGFIITRLITMARSKAQKGMGIALCLLFLTTIGYFNEALTAWFNGNYRGLDATAFIESQCNTVDAQAVDYINANIKEQCNILEMCGLSYTYFNRISVFTGNPTILGWQTHEWLWRSNGGENGYEYPAEVSNRHADVLTIYTSTDESMVRELIEKYDIDYIYIGECELVDGYSQLGSADENGNSRKVEGSYYTTINTNVDLLLGLGEVVFQQWTEGDDGDEAGFNTYLIKVNR